MQWPFEGENFACDHPGKTEVFLVLPMAVPMDYSIIYVVGDTIVLSVVISVKRGREVLL